MEYLFNLNPQPFEAIKKGTKKIEGRVPTTKTKYKKLENIIAGDIIVFTNNQTSEIMKTLVLGKRHYSDVRSMLQSEGTENVLSSRGTIEEGIEDYHSFGGYKEGVKKFGIYAIAITKI